MASRASYLLLEELLEVIQRVTGLSGDEIATEEVIELARHALDAPAAERRGASHDRDVFPTLEEKAAILCERLLVEPPLREEAGEVAYKCLERFLLRNGARWMESPRATVFRFDRVAASSGATDGFRDWVAERVLQAPPSSHPVEQPDLFSYARQPPTTVRLCGSPQPLSSTYSGEPEDSLKASTEKALAAAAARAYEPCEIRLEHSGLSGAEAEGGKERDQEEWEYTSRLVVEQVDALVVVDYLLEHGGFDAACELELHLAQDGPALYLHIEGSSPSRFMRGRAAELNLDIVEYRDSSEIGDLVGAWVLRRWGAIRTAARRRRDRAFQYRFVGRKLQAAWRGSTDEQREVAADAAGVPLHAVNRALTSTGQVTILASHRLDALCRALGVATPRAPGRRRKARRVRDSAPNYRALLEAAKKEGWEGPTIISLFDRVSEGDCERPYVTRPGYQEKEEWIELHELGS